MGEVPADAECGLINRFILMGWVCFYHLPIYGTHDQGTTYTTEPANSDRFPFRGTHISGIPGAQGTGWTQGDACAAKSTIGFFQGPIMGRGGTGSKAAQVVIYGAHYDEFLIRPNASAAKDTLAQVPDDKRIGLFKISIIGHGIKPCDPNTQIRGDLPQFTFVSLAAHNTGLGMIGHHQTDNIGAVPSHGRRIGLDRHIRRYGCDTRGHDSPALLILHQADTAGTGRR
jgi:hypothetical protein